MKSFNSVDENIRNDSTFNSFLDNLDTDTTSSVDLSIAENIENVVDNNLVAENPDDVANSSLVPENSENDTQEECTALVVTKPNSLFVAQKMFKKSIKISIKSFLISLSLGFLNLFI